MGSALLNVNVPIRFKLLLSSGAAARALGGPIKLNGVTQGSDRTDKTNEGPPLSRVSLLLLGMLRNSDPELSTSKAGQVPGSIVWKPTVQTDVVPGNEFGGFKNAQPQLSRRNTTRLESALE